MGKQSPARADRPGEQATGTWQWGSTPKTRRALLDAAGEVFTEQGFSQASIADVVERAGSSVGSLYHHFGGKSELFVALWHEHQRSLEEAASKAVARLRKAAVTDTDRTVLRRRACLPGGQLAAPGPGAALLLR